MRYKYIQIISFFLAVIFLLNFISAFENIINSKKIGNDIQLATDYIDIFYPPEGELLKQGMTLESYLKSLKDNAVPNKNSTVSNFVGTSPTAGTVKIPVLLVKFTDKPAPTFSPADINSAFNSDNYSLTGLQGIGISKYYYKQSYGDLNLIFDVVTEWRTAPNTYTNYINNTSQMELDTINLFDSAIDFNQYDSNNDGRIDGIIIVFSSTPAPPPTGIWPYTRIRKNDYTNSVDGKYLGNTAVVPEKRSSNSNYYFPTDYTVHEFAHVLGLKDFYPINPSTGSQLGNGAMNGMTMMKYFISAISCTVNPINLDAWSRYFLGWTQPVILTTDSNKQISLRSANDFPDAVILKNSHMTNREFFIIENRHRENVSSNLDKCMFNNAAATNGRFAIYHVDEQYIIDNYLTNSIMYDQDGNLCNDSGGHPGIVYEQNIISSVNDCNSFTIIIAENDLYFNGSDINYSYFDENSHRVSPAIMDMTSRSYNDGASNSIIRFQALTDTNQQQMTAKMLVGEETITPTVNLTAGTYYEPILITLIPQTPDSNIYYTLDGSIPTTASPVYSSPFYINSNTTIKAIAKKTDFYVSDVLTVNYTVNATVATPISSIPYEDINYNSQVILSTATPDANIYYTLDGTDPTESSTQYTTPITISQSLTLKARAYKDNWLRSAIATYDYQVLTVNTPQSSPSPENHIYNTLITLSTTTENAQIYYTMDGNTPNQSSTLYQSPIILDHNFTLKAIAYKDGYAPSEVATFIYTTRIPTSRILSITFLEAEIINKIEYRDNIYLLVPHNVNRRLLTPIITTEQGTTINPESGITQDFTIPKQYTVTSPIGSRTYTIYVFNDIFVSPPTATPSGGTYNSPISVTLFSGYPRFSTIRYTTNGQDPLNSPSQIYSSPITISETKTLKARTFYRVLPVTSTNTAQSENVDYQYNQIYQKLFKREYVSELMVEEYTINTLKSEVEKIDITE